MTTAGFNTLFTQHVMPAYAKQLALADAMDGVGSWELDLPSGSLFFENGPSYRVGLLGSYGEGAGTWLWAWANRNTQLPEEVTKAANALKEFGRQKAIPELHESETHDGEAFCHRLSMIAVGESKASAYYRAPYEGGAAYLLISDDIPVQPEHHKLARIQRVIAESISEFQIPHRQAIEAYFAAEGLVVQQTDPYEILATADDGDLRIRFDEKGRLTEMKSLLRASTKPSGGFFNRLFRKD